MATQIYLGMPPPKIKEWIEKNYKIGPKLDEPLTFTSTGNSSVVLNKYGNPDEITLEYAIDNDNFKPYTIGTEILLSDGQKMKLRAIDTNETTSLEIPMASFYKFSMTGSIAASGNIQTLLDKSGKNMNVPNYAYCFLFSDCKSLTHAPYIIPEAYGENCYEMMFNNVNYPFTFLYNTAAEVTELIQYNIFNVQNSITIELICSDKTLLATFDEENWEWTTTEKL